VRAFTPTRPAGRGYGGEVIPTRVQETTPACAVAVVLTARRWLDGVGSPPGQ
jgi:hypothetical protein